MAIDNVRLVASSTPTHCIEWSVDGHIAVNGGTTLTVFKPRLAIEASKEKYKRWTIPPHPTQDKPWTHTANIFENYFHPEEHLQEPKKENEFRQVAWSPNGMSSTHGCILAVINTHRDVILYELSDHPATSEWISTVNISEHLIRLAGVAKGSDITDKRIREFVYSTRVAWSPSIPGHLDQSILAVGNQAGIITLWTRKNREWSSVARFEVHPSGWIQHIAFSRWTSMNNKSQCKVAIASSDGSVVLYELTCHDDLQLEVTLATVLVVDHPATTSGLAFHHSSASQTLACIKPGHVLIWETLGKGKSSNVAPSATVRLPQTINAAAMQWDTGHDRLYVVLHLNDVVVVSKSTEGQWMLDTDLSVTYTMAVRKVAIRAMLRENTGLTSRKLRDTQGNRPSIRNFGFGLSPLNGSMIALATSPYFPLKMEYFTVQKDSIDFAVIPVPAGEAIHIAEDNVQALLRKLKDTDVWANYTGFSLLWEVLIWIARLPENIRDQVRASMKQRLQLENTIHYKRMLYCIAHAEDDREVKTQLRQQILKTSCLRNVDDTTMVDEITRSLVSYFLEPTAEPLLVEHCLICSTAIPFDSVDIGYCENRHPWSRCSVTLKCLMDTDIRSCADCNAKMSLLPEDSPLFMKHCHLCGGHMQRRI